MTSEDDLALLKRMHRRGEITDEQYDTLRRHVLWGTPLPELFEDPPVAPPGGSPRRRGSAGHSPRHASDPPRPPRSDIPSSRTPPPQVPPQFDVPPNWTAQPGPPSVPPSPGYRTPSGPAADEPAGWHGVSAQAVRSDRPSAPIPVVRPEPARPPKRAEPTPRRIRRGPRLIAVLTSLVLAGALAGAGVWWFVLRKTGVAPAVYAHSVCTGVRDWQQDLDSRTSALTKSIAQQADPATIKPAVVTYYTELATRTEQLRHALTGGGTPDVQGGKAYSDALLGSVVSQTAALRDSAAHAARLDPSDSTRFQISVQSLLTNESTSVTAVITALAHPAAGTPTTLRAALTTEPACTPYTG